MNIKFNEEENKYYCYSEVTESSDEEDDIWDEDEDDKSLEVSMMKKTQQSQKIQIMQG